jgi:6-phosphogluconate dehydrogenase
VHDASQVDNFVNGRAAGKSVVGCHSLEELVKSIKRPRKIMLMVMAGEVVDVFINALVPLLEKGDIIIDGGNSHFPDSNRRTRDLEARGIHFVGAGVSGGEEGALLGPSIMPGGATAAWEDVKPIFQAIAARVEDGSPCCDWVGEGGAGHFVKMVRIRNAQCQKPALSRSALSFLARALSFSHTHNRTGAQWHRVR